jgi:hypothetical protein
MSKIEVDAIEPQSGTTLTIGASGDTIIVPAGTVSLPAITTTGDTNTGIFFPAADTIAFTEGGAEAMRIDSSGNVGIGTSSPDALLHIKPSSGNSVFRIESANTDECMIEFSDPEDTNVGRIRYAHSDNHMQFITNASERMRIDSSGNVLINATSAVGTGKFQAALGVAGFCSTMNSVGNQADYIQFWNGSEVGSIKRSGGSAVVYNTSSDYRLKENVSYDFDATTRLKQLKPARFNFIADGTDKVVDGFIAHEVSSVVPEAISGEKDETETKEKVVVNSDGKVIAENIEQADWETGKIADEEGNTKYPTDSTWEATKVVPVYQGIDQSKLVPLLVKTIQELEARITTLENK